jgi:hypothetical protein
MVTDFKYRYLRSDPQQHKTKSEPNAIEDDPFFISEEADGTETTTSPKPKPAPKLFKQGS